MSAGSSTVGLARPVRCLALVLLVWSGTLALRALPIGGSWQGLGAATWALLLGWLAAYCLAFVSVAQGLPPLQMLVAAQQHPSRWSRRWLLVLGALAIAGAGLIAYEFAVVRGYGFTTPVALIRSMEVENAAAGAGGSPISGIGRLLTPALQIAWILAVLRPGEIRGAPRWMLWMATLIVFWQQTLYEGGRFFLATLLVNCLIAKTLASWTRVPQPAPDERRRPRKRRLFSLGTVIALGIAFVAFAMIFINRVTTLELDFGSAYVSYTRTFDIDVGPGTRNRLSGALAPLWFAAAMFWIYITQGPNEAAVLVQHDNLVHAHGLFQFPQLGQAISKMTQVPVGYDVFTLLPNPGTYNTIAGASYIDFGAYGSLLSALVLGAITAAAVAAFSQRRLGALSLWAPILMTLGLFSPIISLVTNLWPALVWALLVGATAPRPARRPLAPGAYSQSIQTSRTVT